jgi:hypothetical protein
MTFDWHLWNRESVSLLGSTIAGLYATLLVCLYFAFSFTELVKFPDLQLVLERNGFFIYLFMTSNIYLMYIFLYVLRGHENTKVVENDKSHGSRTVRFGAIIFGLGAFAYFFIELLTFFEHNTDSPCRYTIVLQKSEF